MWTGFPNTRYDLTKYQSASHDQINARAREVKFPPVLQSYSHGITNVAYLQKRKNQKLNSVQFSPLTDWVIRETRGTIQPRSSSSLFCRWPLWAVLARAGMPTLWCCPSSIASANHGATYPPRCPQGWCWRGCRGVWRAQTMQVSVSLTDARFSKTRLFSTQWLHHNPSPCLFVVVVCLPFLIRTGVAVAVACMVLSDIPGLLCKKKNFFFFLGGVFSLCVHLCLSFCKETAPVCAMCMPFLWMFGALYNLTSSSSSSSWCPGQQKHRVGSLKMEIEDCDMPVGLPVSLFLFVFLHRRIEQTQFVFFRHKQLMFGRFKNKLSFSEEREAKLARLQRMKKIYLPPRHSPSKSAGRENCLSSRQLSCRATWRMSM